MKGSEALENLYFSHYLQEGEAKKQTPAQWQFRINAEMLPSYIPTRVADKVTNIVWELGFHRLTKEQFTCSYSIRQLANETFAVGHFLVFC